jgi:hypothetical protein
MPFIPFGRLVRFDRIVIEKWAEKKTVRGFSRRESRSTAIGGFEYGPPEEIWADLETEQLEIAAR